MKGRKEKTMRVSTGMIVSDRKRGGAERKEENERKEPKKEKLKKMSEERERSESEMKKLLYYHDSL